MKLTGYFESFLEEEVNLNKTRIALLDQRVSSITSFLKLNNTFKENYLDIIPQGSYAHKTIIRPVRESNEFDADLLLELTEFKEWEPEKYVEEVYKAFRGNTVYRDMVSRKTRCVVVNYAGDFHIDVVPYLERHGEKFVTNRHENNFELTDPESYNAWLDEKNRIANTNLVKVIRLIKYLRNFKTTFSIKSILLNILLGQQVNDAALLEDPTYYQDLPTTLRSVMNKLKAYVEQYAFLPTIEDPSGTGENFSNRWNQEGYSNFRKWMIYYAEKIEEAYVDEELSSSLKKWQSIFGDAFKAPQLKPANSLPLAYNNTEQKLSDVGITLALNPSYRIRLKARAMPRDGFREFTLSKQGNRIGIGRTIRFTISFCNVPEPYQIYWKVLNRGEEAKIRDRIRGQIVRGNDILTEPTGFKGSHYVDCFIVKDGICVAKDKQFVNIK
jgi:hypothetical protein